MRFGSVCSGIEAASVAWHPLGWKAAWLSEIEPFPCAVLKHHYPDVPNLGDMTLLPERILSGEVEAPDLFCGGTPCQAFSVAGLRNSLDDARGNLSLTFVGIANAIDHVRSVRGDASAIVFWENVPGVLSTKDNAFGCFLAALAGESDPVTCPEGKWSTAGVVVGQTRTVAWRVLDAQYFGVAQRRRRVFVVASARADFDPAEILFEFDSVRRDTAPSREAGKDSAHSAGISPASHSWPAEISSTLDTTFGTKQGLEDQHVNAGCPMFVPVISPCLETQAGSLRQPCTQAYVVTPPLTASMSTPLGNGGKDAFITAVAQPIAYALDSLASNSMKSANPASGCNAVNVSKALDTSRGLDPSCNQGGIAVAQPIPIDTMNHIGRGDKHSMGDFVPGAPSYTLTKGHSHAVAQAMQVRRLTPIECERLQGFPDNYTDIKAKGKPTPDGPRYKALGNSWAVPVVRWIGERIAQALESTPPKKNP